MSKPKVQITFDFSSPAEPVAQGQEFLSGHPVHQPQPVQKKGRGRKALKDLEVDNVQVPPDEELFKKQYYGIGDVAEMFGVNVSLIRYWEKEFDILEPRKNRKGDRFFRPVDVKNLQLIHDLLRRRKYTIEGARDFIKDNNRVKEKYDLIESLQKLKTFLLQLKAEL